jgi:prepilin-type N-terminal cleavage/methylation domain-containing protein
MKTSHVRKGFTLIELLVIVAIIAIAVSIVVTQIMGARRKSMDASFQSTANGIHRGLLLCCSVPNTSLSHTYGGEICSGDGRYPDDTKMTFSSVSGCSSTGSFQVVIEPGSQNAGNCEQATLTQDGIGFVGC